MNCQWCDEPLLDHERHPLLGAGTCLHRECGISSVVGSVAHLSGKCSCFVDGAEEGDPPWMTKRQAAKAAADLALAKIRNRDKAREN